MLEKTMKVFWKLFFQQLKPKLHEISLYLIALAFCWLLLFHPEFRQGFFMFFTGFYSFSPIFLGLGVLVTAGLLLSLEHVFLKRKKLALEKAIMGWSILGISGVASFMLGSEMLASQSATMMVLVVWNILMSLLMLAQGATQKFYISDENASLVEIVFATGILLGILLISDLYLRLSWAMVLSICIFYATCIVFITTWAVGFFHLKLPDFLKKKVAETADGNVTEPTTKNGPSA
jgi:hypothetical protein